MKIGYIRVSTLEQNTDRQVEAMKPFDLEKIFVEKISAKNTDRPELQNMLEFVREGDTIYIHDFSRLARNTADLLKIVEYLSEKGVALHSNKENIDTSTTTGKFLLTILGAVAELERNSILERQREGIAIAKAQGKYKGGKRKKIVEFESKYKDYKNRIIPSKTALAKELKISRPTLDRRIKEYEQK